MSIVLREQAIIDRYKTLVADAESVPTQYPNVIFDKPGNSKWARFQLLETGSRAAELGVPGKDRDEGILLVSIFFPLDTGTNAITALAKVVRDSFRRVTLSGNLVFSVPSVDYIGESEGYYQVNVSCPFRHTY